MPGGGPVWVEGVLDGSYRRHSLKTSSWERAEQIKRELECGKSVEPVTIDFALDGFLDEQKARAFSEGTQRKSSRSWRPCERSARHQS